MNGNWASWFEWTKCTNSCGGGTQERSRTCTNPAPSENGIPCQGEDTETQRCNTEECASKYN